MGRGAAVPFNKVFVSAPEQVPGRASQQDRGLRERATMAQHRDLMGVELIVLGEPPWMAFLERAWPRTKGRPSRAQGSARQVPGEKTCPADDEGLLIGSDGRERRCRRRLHMLVTHALPILVQEANGHAPGVQIEAPIKLVRHGGASPEVSSS
jgi:hypothetical protein